MTAIATLPVLLGTGIHADRPAAADVGSGGLYSCTTHSLVYQTDGSSWTTWATLGGGGGGSPILAITNTRPGSDTGDYSTSSGSLVDIDGTNLIITFTAPASGNAIFVLTSTCHSGSGGIMVWALRESSTIIAEQAATDPAINGGWTTISMRFYVTGISAGSHTYKWSWYTSAGTCFLGGGPILGAHLMEAWEAP